MNEKENIAAGENSMKTFKNVTIDINNSVTLREYIAYLERENASKRKAWKDFWSNVGTAVAYMLLGAGVSSIVTLAIIGLAVIL